MKISLEVESELESKRRRQWAQGHWMRTDDKALTESDSDTGQRSRGSWRRQLIQSAIDLGNLLCARPCAEWFIGMMSFSLHNNPLGQVGLLLPFFWRGGNVGEASTASKRWIWDLLHWLYLLCHRFAYPPGTWTGHRKAYRHWTVVSPRETDYGLRLFSFPLTAQHPLRFLPISSSCLGYRTTGHTEARLK